MDVFFKHWKRWKTEGGKNQKVSKNGNVENMTTLQFGGKNIQNTKRNEKTKMKIFLIKSS